MTGANAYAGASAPKDFYGHTRGWIRTTISSINNRLLYQLSYTGLFCGH